MSSVHVNVHTHDDGITVNLNQSEFVTWLELKSDGHSVTFFVKDVWDLVSMADRIVQLVEEHGKCRFGLGRFLRKERLLSCRLMRTGRS